MRVFVTGASGWIGSATVRELLAAGHQVLGLARSDSSAAAVSALGAEVFRGSLDDPAGLADAATTCDGVVHLGYNHDFSDMAGAAKTDGGVIKALGEALAGTDKPLVIASGVLGLPGRPALETDQPDPAAHPRVANAATALGLASRGVRSSAIRFAPTVHGDGDHGFVAELVRVAREKGVAAYVGDGAGTWPAVHVTDAARLVRLAVESGAPGSVFHAVAEEGVPTQAIAEAIGAGLGVPVESVPAAEAVDRLGWIGTFFGMDAHASHALTSAALGWEPTGPTLLADLDAGHYTR